MYIDVKRNKLHIQYDKLIDIESDRIIGWTPHYINNYASMNLDINGFKNLIKQLDFKPKASDKVKAWYKEEIGKLKKSKKAHEASKFNLPGNLNKELKEYQKLAVNFFLNVPNSIIAYDMGLGKVQPITNKVLSKNGWIEIGKLKVGDKIYNSKGTLSNVIGIYPQGIIKNYEVVFTDGSKTNCGEEHLWNVQTPNWRKRTPDKYTTKTLKELINEGINYKRYHKRDKCYYTTNKWFIPLIKPIQWDEQKHIIHPYNLGLLLGDGSILSTVNLCNSDKEIQNKFIKLANCEVNRVIDDLVVLSANPYKYELQRLNLWGHKSPEKYIPNEYLHDSIENRIQLLQGLMDTDGTIQGSNVSYSTKSLQLAKDIRYLVQSLGGTSRINNKTVNRELYFNINIQLPINIIPFTTQYHLNRYKPKTKYKPYRAIKEVNYINNCEGVCIKTDAEDSLYITDDFILTHNTLIAINCIKALKAKKTLIVCPSYLKFNWCEELLKWSKLKFTVINGRPEQREKQFKIFENSNKNVLIINYEQIRVKLKKNGKVEQINVHSYLQKTKFNLIIWDEAHRLKNRESQMSNGAFALNSDHKLMLTGTPTTKNAGEFYNLFRILDRQRFKSYWTFVKYYMHVSEGMRGYEIGHVTRPKEFKELLNQYMIRRMKEDVANELPDKVFIDCPVIMNEDQERLYKKVLEEYLYPDDNVIESDVERFIRLCQCTQNPCIIGGKDTSIIRDSILDLLEDLPDRVMIGCVYVDMSVNLKESIEKKFKDRKVYIINSKIKHREKIVDEFKQDKTGILVTTIKCLSEGANIDCCDNMVYADIEWNYGINAQFENRIHRMTSTRVKTYYRFIVENTVHKYKHRKIMNEKANSQYLLGDKDNSINKIMNDFRRDMLHE